MQLLLLVFSLHSPSSPSHFLFVGSEPNPPASSSLNQKVSVDSNQEPEAFLHLPRISKGCTLEPSGLFDLIGMMSKSLFSFFQLPIRSFQDLSEPEIELNSDQPQELVITSTWKSGDSR